MAHFAPARSWIAWIYFVAADGGADEPARRRRRAMLPMLPDHMAPLSWWELLYFSVILV